MYGRRPAVSPAHGYWPTERQMLPGKVPGEGSADRTGADDRIIHTVCPSERRRERACANGEITVTAYIACMRSLVELPSVVTGRRGDARSPR